MFLPRLNWTKVGLKEPLPGAIPDGGCGLNWTKVGLKDIDIVRERGEVVGLNWTKVGLKVGIKIWVVRRAQTFELD